MKNNIMFAPSLMCMDFLDIKNQMLYLNEKADFYHVDIMDGHFVKNITLSPDFVNAISGVAKIPMDCHLMVTDPNDYIDMLAKSGAGYVSVHAETINTDVFRTLNRIEALGMKKGVVLNPATPLSYIQEYIHKLDKITIMSVDVGFAGQPFIREMLNKVKQAKKLKEKYGYKYIIEIDGSCNEGTFKDMYEAGVECFIVGSSGLFNLDTDLDKAWDKMINNFEKNTGVSLA